MDAVSTTQSFGSRWALCSRFDTMSSWRTDFPYRGSPKSDRWRHNSWDDSGWHQSSERKDIEWNDGGHKRPHSAGAAVQADSQGATESYARKRCERSKGSSSAEPQGTVYTTTQTGGTPPDVRRRVEMLSADIRGLPISAEQAGDFVAAAAIERAAAKGRERMAAGSVPAAPTVEPRKVQPPPPRTPRPVRKEPAEARPPQDAKVQRVVGAVSATNLDLNAAATMDASSCPDPGKRSGPTSVHPTRRDVF